MHANALLKWKILTEFIDFCVGRATTNILINLQTISIFKFYD